MSDRIRRSRRDIQSDEEASARLTAGFVVAGGLTFILLGVVLFTDVPAIGPKEGELAPNLSGKVHYLGATDWTDYDLYSEIDHSWSAEDNPEAKWFVIQFMDTDCIHCWQEASTMTDLYNQFGNRIEIISVAISLNIPNHDSDAAEIIAFQEKTSGDCNSGNNDCSERGGDPHDWAYFDDLGASTIDPWGVSGTPFVVILQPDGTVAWNQGQRTGTGQTPEIALNEQLPVLGGE